MSAKDQDPQQPQQVPGAPVPGAGANGSPGIRLKKILVPVDFSACSRKALDYAVAFAGQFQASLVLVHVLDLNYMGTGLGEIEVPLLEAELRQNATQQLDHLVREVLAGRVAYETSIRQGRPWHEIDEAARSLDADLIIMGTHGYTGLRHVVMGSTTERVVRHAPCPVLIVREREREFVQP